MSKRWPKRKVKPFFCCDCGGWRPHTIKRRETDGCVQQMIVCQVCLNESKKPGIHCGKCGESTFRTKVVRHPRPDMTIWLKECRKCGELIRIVGRKAKGY